MAEMTMGRSLDVDKRLSRGIEINWEMVAWAVLIVLTLVTRLWGLGERAMSHDESLHTYYSWKLAVGRGYTHDPMMHGPFLFHGTALFYFLFGANDFTSRLLSVATGLALVMSPLLVRKWLGNVGALAAGIMLLVSPTVMYYSRYIRHDIPVELFTALMFVGFFRFVDSRNGRWVILAMAAAAGAITSAEMAYINGFVLVTFIAVALIVERMTARRADRVAVILGALGLGLLIFATLAHEGFLGDVATENSPRRVFMQMSFLFGGPAVIYSLIVGLIARFHSSPTEEEVARQHEGWILADATPQGLFPRFADPARATVMLVVGGLAAGAGLLSYRALSDGVDAATPLIGAGDAATGAGAGVLYPALPVLEGLAAVAAVAGALVAFLGLGGLLWAGVRHGTNLAMMVFGSVFALMGGIVAVFSLSEQLISDVSVEVAAAVAAVGVVVAVYGLLGFVLEDESERRLAAAIAHVPGNALAAGVGVFLVIYVLLFSTFFTNPDGLSGFFDSITYWLAQHDVHRGGQPWYYYALLAPMYEFLPLILALAAVAVYSLKPGLRVSRGNDDGSTDNPTPAARSFVPMLIAWAGGNFWIYSWAGEKMPWLTVHLVVPMAFLAGRLVGDMFRATDWDAMRRRGWQLAGLTVVLLVATAAWLSRIPTGGEDQQMAGWIVGIPIVFLILWAIFRVASEMSGRQARLAVALALAGLLLVLNTRYSLIANFVNDELATEYIVYAHGTPDDKLVYETLLDMQERLGVDDPLSIAFDDEVSWPFTWYFRDTDWYEATYVAKNASSASNKDIVLVGDPNYDTFHPHLRDRYEYVEYRRMWWPNEGYKNLSLDSVWQAITDPALRRNWLKILVYRQYTADPMAEAPEPKSLTDWYHQANMRMYIKRDIIEKVWPIVQAQPGWVANLSGETAEAEALELAVDLRFSEADGQPVVAPKDVAIGPDGRVYVLDQGNSRVVVYDQSGEFEEVIAAGDLRYSEGGSAWGLAVDDDGVLYVADTWNHRILKYVDGELAAEWGTFGDRKQTPREGLLELYGPRDIAIGPDGNLYVTDTGSSRIVKYSPDGEPLESFGEDGVEPGQFKEPVGIAFDPGTGDFFVADLWNFRVQRLSPTMRPVTACPDLASDGDGTEGVCAWPVPEWDENEFPDDKAYLAVGPGSVVAVGDPFGKRIWFYSAEGETLGSMDVLADETGLDKPIGLAFDDQGRLYVAASNTGLVTRYEAPEAVREAMGLEDDAADGGEEDDAAEDAESGDADEGEPGQGDPGAVNEGSGDEDAGDGNAGAGDDDAGTGDDAAGDGAGDNTGDAAETGGQTGQGDPGADPGDEASPTAGEAGQGGENTGGG